MSTTSEPDVYRLQGYLGILAKKLKVDVQLDMQERLTLQMKSWNDAPAIDVEAFYKKDGYFWIPRFFPTVWRRSFSVRPTVLRYSSNLTSAGRDPFIWVNTESTSSAFTVT